MDNYFKLEPERRGESILKKMLTDKLVNIERLTQSIINKNTYSNLGDFIKKYFDKYFGVSSDYIYCTLGEFFGDNDDFFNKVCKEDAARILKYYEKYLLNELGSNFYNRLKQETEQVKGSANKNSLNNGLNPQEQKAVLMDKNNNPKIVNINEQNQNLVDKNVWKTSFLILLPTTILLFIGAGVAYVGFGASSLWIIASSIMIPFMQARPHLISFSLLSLVIWFLYDLY